MNLFLEFLKEHLRSEFVIFFGAALPFTELRAAIPLAVSLGIEPVRAFTLGVLGNIMPVPILLLGLNPLVRFLKSTPILGMDRFFEWLYERTLHKSDNVEKYGALGLILFTAIPFPTTGAWTACVAASIFRIRFANAFFSIVLGILLAGILVTLFSFGVLGLS